jgi:hypothetical protein
MIYLFLQVQVFKFAEIPSSYIIKKIFINVRDIEQIYMM